MEIKRIIAAYFSPTGNVKKIADAMAREIGEGAGLPVETIDFTGPQARSKQYTFSRDDLLIIGLPVYAGRLPNKILPFVQENLKGDDTLSLPFVCYGNRAFDDGLSELVYEQRNTGFKPAAAGAFATQHAFATALSHGRPREEDLEEAGDLARGLWECAAKAGCAEDLAEPEVAGNMPPGPYYRPLRMDGEPAVFLKAKPLTDPDRCIHCGTCARVCSMGSIDPEDVTNVPGICIKCQACVTSCPKDAKYFDHPDFLSHKEMLESNYTEEKPNSIWPASLKYLEQQSIKATAANRIQMLRKPVKEFDAKAEMQVYLEKRYETE